MTKKEDNRITDLIFIIIGKLTVIMGITLLLTEIFFGGLRK